MLIRHRERKPKVDPSAWIAPSATLVGDVTIASDTRIMYGAILDSEGSSIAVGASTIVSENVVVRATATDALEHSVSVADHVLLGPHATLLGCRVERAAYIATGATVLQAARIGQGAVVAVGALVHARAVVPDGGFVPPNMIAIGDPMEIYGSHDPHALIEAVARVGFLETAFGVDIGWDDRVGRYVRASEVRAEEFGAHRGDEILD
jgi:carbonic anhydrase/acetyltransferase-like protein (isoleucine patch superfamily)